MSAATVPLAETAARAVLGIAAAYAGVGTAFGVAFVTQGIDRLDPSAHGARWTFRLLILPASALLWPLLLRRWLAGRTTPPLERNAHDRAAGPAEVA